MAFGLHEAIQRLLLIGVHLPRGEPVPAPRPPAALEPLIAALAAAHARFDARAIEYGRRYRSGYWSIYLLSALAVLSAVLPLGLGWDSQAHRLHPYAGGWAVCEVLLIGSVSLIYWRGHRTGWREEWLAARTTAELSVWMPLLAPLVKFAERTDLANWYLRVFEAKQDLPGTREIEALCQSHEALARERTRAAWRDPAFAAAYANWAIELLTEQQRYHRRLAARQQALLHRAHSINATLFGLTGLAAVCHLFLHTLWLTLVTTFFPALGASLHGAMAQSEAHRLANTSARLVGELEDAVGRIRGAVTGEPDPQHGALQAAIQGAIALLLEEHQSWHLVVRPHHLPLA